MGKDSGYLVKTKSGNVGRTYHHEVSINNKIVVHVEVDGKKLKMLCDPKSLELTGYVD